MDNGDPSIVDKPDILKPPVVPAPGKPQREDEATSQKAEKDVDVDLDPLSYGSCCDHRHFYTEADKVYPAAIIVRIHLGAREL